MEQFLANLIQTLNQALIILQASYDFEELKPWAVEQTLTLESLLTAAQEQFATLTGVEYDSAEAAALVVKEDSTVTVMVDHMTGMMGTTATVISYSLPAMLANVQMDGGDNHKWLTNDEVQLGAGDATDATDATADADTAEPAMDMG